MFLQGMFPQGGVEFPAWKLQVQSASLYNPMTSMLNGVAQSA